MDIKSEILLEDIGYQSDGKMLIASGRLISAGGKYLRGIVRLNSDGSVDQEFNLGLDLRETAVIHDIIVQNDDKFLLCGQNLFEDPEDIQIMRFNPDGSVDETFQFSYASDVVLKGALTQNGKIVLSVYPYPRTNPSLIRINEDGSLDEEFKEITLSVGIRRIDMETNDLGEIFIVGDFDTYNDEPINGLIKLNSHGELDSEFSSGSGPTGQNYSFLGGRLDFQSNGKLIMVGRFDEYNGSPAVNIVRLNVDGSVDETFVQSEQVPEYFPYGVRQVYVLPNDQIIVADGDYILRLNSDGSFDSSFTPGHFDYGIENAFNYQSPITIVGSENELFVAGKFIFYNDNFRIGLVKIDNEGNFLDYNAQLGGRPILNAVETLPDGDFVVGGVFFQVGNYPISNIARFNSDGTLDEVFTTNIGEGADGIVTDITASDNGSIWVSGLFSNVGSSFGSTAKLLDNGNQGVVFEPEVHLVYGDHGPNKILEDGNNVYVGGMFRADETRNLIKYTTSDGISLGQDNTFNTSNPLSPEEFESVLDIAAQSDGKVVVAGGRLYSENPGILMRFNSNGTIDQSFQSPNLDNFDLKYIEVLDNDELIFGGFYSGSYSSNDVAPIFHTTKDGTIIDNSIGTMNGGINTFRVVGEEDFIVGGDFDVLGSKNINSLGRMSLSDVADDFYTGLTAHSIINDIAITDDNSILVVGDFSKIRNGFGFSSLAKISLENSVPEITGTSKNLVMDEDTQLTLSMEDLIIEDDNYPVDLTMKVTTGYRYTASGSIVRPYANYNGPLSVTVTVDDGNKVSTTFNVEIDVLPINDPPVIVPNQSITITEYTDLPSVAIKVEDPDENDTLEDWTIVSGNEEGLFAINPINGQLSVSDEIGFNKEIIHFLDIKVSDGELESEVEQIEILTRPLDVQSSDNLTVYPNPSSDYLKVDTQHIIEIAILDLKGRKVKMVPVKDKIDISDLSNGTYMLLLKGDEINIVRFTKRN